MQGLKLRYKGVAYCINHDLVKTPADASRMSEFLVGAVAIAFSGKSNEEIINEAIEYYNILQFMEPVNDQA